jgi:hypothetical protein
MDRDPALVGEENHGWKTMAEGAVESIQIHVWHGIGIGTDLASSPKRWLRVRSTANGSGV